MFTTDLMIGLAYIGISLIIWGLVRKIKIPFSPVILCFGVFIGACGMTHLMEVWTLWNPNYWASAGVKVVTALASVGTGLYLHRLKMPIVSLVEAGKTAREKALELERQAKIFDTALSSSPDFFYVFDTEKRFSYANRALLNLWGLNLDQVIGKNFADLGYPQELVEVHRRQLDRALKGEIVEGENSYTNPQGLIGYYEYRFIPIFDANGRVQAISGTTRDITNRRALEAERIKAESATAILNERENFRNLFQQTPELVCILRGPEHRFEFVNEAHIRVLGFNATGMGVREAQPESVEVHDLLDQVYATGQTVQLNEIAVTVGDRKRFFNVTYAARRNPEGEIDGIMILGIEVTDQVHAREQLAKAKAALEEKSAFLETVIQQMPLSVFFAEAPSGKLTFANKQLQKIWRHGLRSADTVEGYFDYIGVHPDGTRFKGEDWPLARAIKYGEVIVDEHIHYQRGDGTHGIIRISAAPVRNSAGEIIAAVVLSDDVTKQKEAEAKLRESQQRLELALKASNIGFFDWDIPHDRLIFSEEMVRDWGLVETPRNFSEAISHIYEEDRNQVLEAIHKSLDDTAPFAIEYRVVRASDKKIAWMHVRGEVSRNSKGEPERFIGTCLNITERKSAEEALRAKERTIAENEARFRQLANSIPQLAWMANADGQIYWLNDKWYEYTGDQQKELEKFVHPDHLAEFINKRSTSLKSGEPLDMQFPLRGSAGEYRWYLTRMNPIRSSSGEVIQWFGTGTDIDVQKRAEQELGRAKDEAERASQLKSAFLANMSHEIRTPLGAMLGFADLLRDPNLESLERGKYLDILSRNGEQLSVIINDILDLSKVEAGQLSLEKMECDPIQMAEDVTALFAVKARERKLELSFIRPEEPISSIVSDPVRIRQVLMNLVGNAVKFTEKGFVRVSIFESEVSGKRVINYLVQDTGIGIIPGQKERIFEVFVQGDNSMTRKFGGTGLGLALSRSLARKLGGEITVESSGIGHGSLFHFSVSDLQSSEAEEKARSIPSLMKNEQIDLAPDSLSGVRVLIVDDAPDNRQLLWRYIKNYGGEADFAENGLEGCRMALTNQYDVVLMDIQMPVMDGYTATEKLRSYNYNKPVIALTAHGMAEVHERCMHVGCDDCLLKPVNKKHLIRTLHRFTERVES